MATTHRFCTFSLGELRLGVDVLRVQEVIRSQEMTRVPTASPVVRGLINLRGQVVMAIDLRRRLGLGPAPDGAQPLNVVMRADDRPVSLLVDDVGDVLELSPAEMEPPPETLQGGLGGLMAGLFKLDGRLLIVLDADRLIDFDAAA